MTIAQPLRQKGADVGTGKGIEKGRADGEREATLKIVRNASPWP
ncbi:hypothetical protein ACLHDD_18425 [Pantoea sp. NSTU24]